MIGFSDIEHETRKFSGTPVRDHAGQRLRL